MSRDATVVGTLRYHLMCIISRTDPDTGWRKNIADHRDALKALAILDAAQVFGAGDEREVLVPDPSEAA